MKGKQNGEATSVTNPPECGGGGGGGAAAPPRDINGAAAASAAGRGMNRGLTERVFDAVAVLVGSDGKPVQLNRPLPNASK